MRIFLLISATLFVWALERQSPPEELLKPFPEFHTDYFRAGFWGREDFPEHPLLFLRDSAKSQGPELFKTLWAQDSVVKPHRQWIYAHFLRKRGSLSTSGEFDSLLRQVKEKEWIARSFYEKLRWIEESQGEALALIEWKKSPYRKSLGEAQLEELEKKEMNFLFAQNAKDSLMGDFYRFLIRSDGWQRDTLLAWMEKDRPWQKEKLSFWRWKTLVNSYRWADQKDKALKVAKSLKESQVGKAHQKKFHQTNSYLYAALGQRGKEAYHREKVVEHSVGDKEKIKNIGLLIRALKKAGKHKERKEWTQKLQKLAPRSSKVAGILWVKAFELEQNKKYKEAASVYADLEKRFPGNRNERWAGFRRAFMMYKDSNYRKAIQILDEELGQNPNLWAGSAQRLFRSECYRLLGEHELAKASYFATIDDFPLGYYAHRARQKLKKYYAKDSLFVPGIETFDATPQELNLWLGLDSNATTSLGPQLEMIEDLLAVGAWDLVDREFAELKMSTLLDRYHVGVLMLRYGYLAKAYGQARRLLSALPRQQMRRIPRGVAELFYPRIYPEELEAELDSSGISPYFVMGLMRQESILDDQIQSPAGARGLLQIMTYTGEKLAEQVGYEGFHKDWLYNPLMGLKLGVHYVKDLYKEYGDLRYVLTNYNAGPKPTKRWIRTNGDKNWETAVEEVSYRETRDYVKKVLGNYWTYEMIWEGR